MGGTLKWMVYQGKSHLEMDDLGVPPIQGNPPIFAMIQLPLGDPIFSHTQSARSEPQSTRPRYESRDPSAPEGRPCDVMI